MIHPTISICEVLHLSLSMFMDSSNSGIEVIWPLALYSLKDGLSFEATRFEGNNQFSDTHWYYFAFC
jgi:hypothetical protein